MKTFTHPLLFWIAAALLVLATHGFVDPYSSAAGSVLKLGAIVVAAFLYIRFTARNATVDHAVFVGVAWLMLDIISEMTLRVDLLGSTAGPAMRNLMLVTWIAAPALFARVCSIAPEEHLKSSLRPHEGRRRAARLVACPSPRRLPKTHPQHHPFP